jgi:hypothetical protein
MNCSTGAVDRPGPPAPPAMPAPTLDLTIELPGQAINIQTLMIQHEWPSLKLRKT